MSVGLMPLGSCFCFSLAFCLEESPSAHLYIHVMLRPMTAYSIDTYLARSCHCQSSTFACRQQWHGDGALFRYRPNNDFFMQIAHESWEQLPNGISPTDSECTFQSVTNRNAVFWTTQKTGRPRSMPHSWTNPHYIFRQLQYL